MALVLTKKPILRSILSWFRHSESLNFRFIVCHEFNEHPMSIRLSDSDISFWGYDFLDSRITSAFHVLCIDHISVRFNWKRNWARRENYYLPALFEGYCVIVFDAPIMENHYLRKSASLNLRLSKCQTK